MKTTIQRFESFINKNAPGGCWLWTGVKIDKRYGSFGTGGRANRKTNLAHRFAWENYVGPIPNGLNVCHDCPTGDNPLCVNPSHLFIGTQKDNLQDARQKGRIHDSHGEDHYNSKLSSDSVSEIRTLYKKGVFGCNRLAKLYGVSHQNIWIIVNGLAWRSA